MLLWLEGGRSQLNVHLRPLAGEDWLSLRRLRLHALRTEPGVFFRRFDEEAGLPDAEWIALATGDDTHQIFGLLQGEHLIGISGVFADRNDSSGETASFGMSYILPQYRGRGLAARLYEARLTWARARPRFARAVVGHRRSNAASQRSIERFGFRHTGDLPHRWHDGSQEDNVRYELRLRDRPVESGAPMKSSDDPTLVAPDNYTIAFENERVRVLRFRAGPRERWDLHSHPDSVVVSLSDYQVRNGVPGNAPTIRHARAGDIAWISALSHTGENAGDTDMECILVELKDSDG